MAQPLRLGFWNLNGYNSGTLGNKLKTNDSELAVNNFKHFVKCRNKSGKRTFGGLSLFINQKLAKLTESRTFQQKTKTPSGVNLIEIILDSKTIIYLGTVYLSPPNYERNNNDDLISEIEAEMLSFCKRVALSYKVIVIQEQVKFKKS